MPKPAVPAIRSARADGVVESLPVRLIRERLAPLGYRGRRAHRLQPPSALHLIKLLQLVK